MTNNIWAHDTKGVLGLRAFRIEYPSSQPRLILNSTSVLPHMLSCKWSAINKWTNGNSVALCAGKLYPNLPFNHNPHEVPDKDCACGLYAETYLSKDIISRRGTHILIALTESTGKVIIGEKGIIRAEKSRVIGFCEIIEWEIIAPYIKSKQTQSYSHNKYLIKFANYYQVPIIPLEQAEETILEHNYKTHNIERTDQWKPARRSKLYESRENLHGPTELSRLHSLKRSLMLPPPSPRLRKEFERMKKREEERQKKSLPRVWITDRAGNRIDITDDINLQDHLRFSHGFTPLTLPYPPNASDIIASPTIKDLSNDRRKTTHNPPARNAWRNVHIWVSRNRKKFSNIASRFATKYSIPRLRK